MSVAIPFARPRQNLRGPRPGRADHPPLLILGASAVIRQACRRAAAAPAGSWLAQMLLRKPRCWFPSPWPTRWLASSGLCSSKAAFTELRPRQRELTAVARRVEVTSREPRRMTLHEHGASIAEIQFLAPCNEAEPCRRVELNAMTSRQLVDFVEAALADHGVAKVMPDAEVLQQHARHQIETKLTGELIAANAEAIARQAAAALLPDNLAEQVALLMRSEPTLSWDQALARLI